MIEVLAHITGRMRQGASFSAGVVLQDDVVVEAATAVRFMRGWQRDRVRSHCAGQGWQVSVVWRMERAGYLAQERKTDSGADGVAGDP